MRKKHPKKLYAYSMSATGKTGEPIYSI